MYSSSQRLGMSGAADELRVRTSQLTQGFAPCVRTAVAVLILRLLTSWLPAAVAIIGIRILYRREAL